MLVEAFVAELAVEAFDVTVLHPLPRLDQNMLDVVLLGPGDERTGGELRTVVGAHGSRVTAEAGGLIQQSRHVRRSRRYAGSTALHLRNVKGFGWNHKRVYRIYRELELNLRIKPRKRLVREKPQPLAVP